MSELVEFIRGCLDADEQTARAAIDPDRPGTHWQWVNNETDEPFDSDPGDEFRVSLRTVEEFPTRSGVGYLPAFPLGYVEADETYALPHIARHDPARVLAEVNAKRAILDKYERASVAFEQSANPATSAAVMALAEVVDAMAQCFRGEPGWRDVWGTQ